MASFTTDPDELEAEVRALPLTFEPLISGPEEAMSLGDQRLVERFFSESASGTPASIRVFRQLCRKYPEVASLKNHLHVALAAAGKHRQAEKIEDEIFRVHPDYVFGHINRAAGCLQDDDRVQRIPEILGARLRLRDLMPEQPLFHFTQIRGFYNVVALFHLREGRIDLARRLHSTLVDLIGTGDAPLEKLGKTIGLTALSELRSRILEEEEHEIRVQVAEPPSSCSPEMFRPNFQHAQIEVLYEYGVDFPGDEIDAILALPKETLIADLEAVLRDAVARAPLYLNKSIDYCDDVGAFFPLHALVLLGEVGTPDSLAVVLEALSQTEEALDFWFGDILQGYLWIPIYRLIDLQPAAPTDWMLKPGVHARGKGVVGKAVSQIALHHPERRHEILDWFRHLLDFLLDSPPEDNILDTHLVSSLVSSLCDLRAIELLDLVQAHSERGHVSETWLGDMAEIEKELANPDRDRYRQVLQPTHQLYRTLNRAFGDRPEWEEQEPPRDVHDSGFFSAATAGKLGPGTVAPRSDAVPAAALPPRPKPKPSVGRNAPCPCGSGKKYKKCCLGKD